MNLNTIDNDEDDGWDGHAEWLSERRAGDEMSEDMFREQERDDFEPNEEEE